MDMNRIGKKIAGLRKVKGFTQNELAERLCISPQAISKWETGAGLPEASVLIKLSELFEVSIDEIIKTEGFYNKAADFFNRNTTISLSKILDYIPRIERWASLEGTGFNLYYSFPAVIAEAICCIEALEKETPEYIKSSDIIDKFNDLMHITGIGYGFLWLDNDEMIGELWRVNNFHEMADRSMRYYGRDYLWLESGSSPVEEMRKAIIWSINNGRPVVMENAGFMPEFSIVAGYKDNGNTLIGWTFCTECVREKTDKGMFISPARWNVTAAKEFNRYKILVIGDKTDATLSDTETIEYAIEVLNRTESVDKGYETYVAGFDAYQKWLEVCESINRAISYNDDSKLFPFYLHTNSLYAQKCTVPFLKELASRHDIEISDIINRLIKELHLLEADRNSVYENKNNSELYATMWKNHIKSVIKFKINTFNYFERILTLLNGKTEKNLMSISVNMPLYDNGRNIDLSRLLNKDGQAIPYIDGKYVLETGLAEPYYLNEAFDLPVKMDFTLEIQKLPGYYGFLTINSGDTRFICFDIFKNEAQVCFNDPITRQQILHLRFPFIASDCKNICIIIDKQKVEVFFNNNLIVSETHLDYTKKYKEDPDFKLGQQFGIGIGKNLKVKIESLVITNI